MDKAEYIQKRKGKYMAQILESCEQHLEPHLPPEAAGALQDFKGLVRARLNALSSDAIDVMALSADTEINALAVEVRDRMSPVGRP